MSKLKKTIYNNEQVSKVVVPIYHKLKRTRNFSSKNYWERRYAKQGNSGAGSYGRLAQFKADVLNEFARKNSIKTVLEFGSGDGAQLGLFNFKNYIGFDVSPTSIRLCAKKFASDKTKSFFLYEPDCFFDNHNVFSADLTLSLDVIYHLVEDEVFDKYMRDLFAASNKYVIIYASNMIDDKLSRAQHVRHRKFSDWVKKNAKGWKLDKKLDNQFKLKADQIDESFADFYIYKKAK
ncbi:MAG: hypothetical protein ACREGA_02170 [Candidatus Saccharimonadales bacterium]